MLSETLGQRTGQLASQETATVRTMDNEVLKNFPDKSGERPRSVPHRKSHLNSQGIPVECKSVVLQMVVDPQAQPSHWQNLSFYRQGRSREYKP